MPQMDTKLTGTTKALLYEYKKAIDELMQVITPLTREEIIRARDNVTSDPNCISIQTILSHLVYAGYAYIVFIENHAGQTAERQPKLYFETAGDYIKALNDLFDYSLKVFTDHPSLPLHEEDNKKKIVTNWGQEFDIEQMMEHAIVHILKHRRQIQRMLAEGNSALVA